MPYHCNECVHFMLDDEGVHERCTMDIVQINNAGQACLNCTFTDGYDHFQLSEYPYSMEMCELPDTDDINFIIDQPCPDAPKKESKKKKAKKKKAYISKDGFELVSLNRGFTEIQPLWDILMKITDRCKADCFICGGYARYCASPKYEPVPAGDIDIYSENDKVYKYLTRVLSFEIGLKVKAENNMALTLEQPTQGAFHYMPPIQLIKPVVDGAIVAKGNKETILSNFDFTIIRAAIESPTEVLVDADFIHDESKNVLRLKNIHCPVSSLLRCLKYVGKGYWLRPIEAAKLFADWMNRDDEYRLKILDFIDKADIGEGLSQEEVDELERLMRID